MPLNSGAAMGAARIMAEEPSENCPLNATCPKAFNEGFEEIKPLSVFPSMVSPVSATRSFCVKMPAPPEKVPTNATVPASLSGCGPKPILIAFSVRPPIVSPIWASSSFWVKMPSPPEKELTNETVPELMSHGSGAILVSVLPAMVGIMRIMFPYVRLTHVSHSQMGILWNCTR